MMAVSKAGLSLIKRFEGLELNAYPDPGSGGDPWTIGYGSTMYPDGTRVKKGDTCTEQQAEIYLWADVNRRAAALSNLKVNQNQFDAILSFCYNLGLGAWNRSTLRKKVIADRNDPAIRDEFLKWTRAGGKVLKGLVIRRQAEADHYFS